MPKLSIPVMHGSYSYGIQVRIFIHEMATKADIQFVSDSVQKARDILTKYRMDIMVSPPGGWDDQEQIGTFSYSAPLLVDTIDLHGRKATTDKGAEEARAEVEKKIKTRFPATDVPGKESCVVLFGPCQSQFSRGKCTESMIYPWFCTVDVAKKMSKTTMLHEVLHCANAQHWMAKRDVTDDSSQDDTNIMAQVMDHEADFRVNINMMQLDLIRRCYFRSVRDW